MSDGVCYVYWIHLPEHTDVFTQGYVGFTSTTVEDRFAAHVSASNRKSNNGCKVLNRALRKYGSDNVAVDTLCISDKEYGLWLENKLRPVAGVGWNIAAGGAAPCQGVVLSEESRAAISRANTGRKHSQETKDHLSAVKKGKPCHESTLAVFKEYADKKHKWLNGRCDKGLWTSADTLYQLWEPNKCGSWALATRAGDGFKWTSIIVLHKHFKSGWNPSEDQEYLAWREAYLEEQRKEPNGT